MSAAEVAVMSSEQLAHPAILKEKEQLKQSALREATAGHMDRQWMETYKWACDRGHNVNKKIDDRADGLREVDL